MAVVSIEEYESLLGLETLAEKRAANAALFGTQAELEHHKADAAAARERMKAYSPRALLAYIAALEGSLSASAPADAVTGQGEKLP